MSDTVEVLREDWNHFVKAGQRASEYLLEAVKLQEVVLEAERQIVYLHEKFGETGSGNAVLAKIRAALKASADTLAGSSS